MKFFIFPEICLLCFIFYFCLVFAENEDILNQAGPVVFTNILYRHGARTPIESYPNDPYKNESVYWPNGWGQLTNFGKYQHYKQGQWFRKRYSHLVREEKYSPYLIYVQSTDKDRTLMSAMANLAGMFPPASSEEWSDKLEWQPIPVHTTPEALDKVLAMNYPCPKYDEEYNALFKTKELLDYNKQHQELYDYLSKHTGCVVDGPKQIEYLYSTLFIEALNNYTLPNWTEGVFPEKMHEVASFSFGLYTHNKALQRLKSGPLLKEMIKHMDEKRSGKLNPDRNFWIYSAHDTTVANMLNTLGNFVPHTPPFVATVMLELRRSLNDEYSVTLFYKNSTELEPELLTIPGCTPVCPLNKFKDLVQDVIPVDWVSECHSHQLFDLTSDQPYNSLAIFAMVTSTLLVFLLLTSTSLYWHKQKPEHLYKKLKMETL